MTAVEIGILGVMIESFAFTFQKKAHNQMNKKTKGKSKLFYISV